MDPELFRFLAPDAAAADVGAAAAADELLPPPLGLLLLPLLPRISSME